MKIKIAISLVFACQIIGVLQVANAQEGNNIAIECIKIQNGICMPKGYNKQQIPSMPITVKVMINIITLTEIDDKLATVDILTYIKLAWKDPGLLKLPDTVSGITDCISLSGSKWILLSKDWLEKIWQPDVFIYGMKGVELPKWTTGTALRVLNTTEEAAFELNLHQHVKVKFYCEMVFSNYPLDVQECHFWLGSYIHQSDIMDFHLEDIVEGTVEETVVNLEYEPVFAKLTRNLTFDEDAFDNLRYYSVVGFTLKLKRHFVKHILSYYCPSSIIVAISWISFITPPEAIPARMALLITVLLVLVNLLGTIIDKQPPSVTPTALVIWMSACIIFASGALIAYGVLLAKRQTWRRNNKTATSQDKLSTLDQHDHASQNTCKEITNKQMEKEVDKNKDDSSIPGKFDRLCLLWFPLAFLLFNLIYWPIVMSLRRPLKKY